MATIRSKLCSKHGKYSVNTTRDKCPSCTKSYDKNVRNKESVKIYNSKQWKKEARPATLLRDGFKCVVCKSKDNLVVDHIKELIDGGDAYNIDNLQTLCKKCHAIKTEEEKNKRVYRF